MTVSTGGDQHGVHVSHVEASLKQSVWRANWTKGIGIENFQLRERMVLDNFINLVWNRAFDGEAVNLSIICYSITLGSKINHVEDCTLWGRWWQWWPQWLLMTLSTAWSRPLGTRMPTAVGRAWTWADRGIRSWTWLVRILISFASTRAWCRADRWLRTWPVAAMLPVGAALLSFAFLQLRGAWWAPRPPMLASSRLADINGGAKSKEDKEKQEAEAFCSQLHPSVCIYWLCGLWRLDCVCAG